MSGNKTGGKKAAITNRAMYGNDFYKKIGAIGGSRKVPKGFAINRKLASQAGANGGTRSRKPKVVV